MNVIRAGSTLYLKDPDNPHPHLWVVLTDPTGDPEWVLTVMLTTHRLYTDDTLILMLGDHPFVKHPTSVHYSTAQPRQVRQILRQMEIGRCHLRPTLRADLLRQAQRGFLQSPRAVIGLVEKCKPLMPDVG